MAYGEVQGKTWRSPSIRGLSDSEKLAWSYLLSNQHSNMLGYYLLPLPYMADDLEWSPERAVQAIEALERRSLIAYDSAAQVVFVCKYLKYNRLSSGKRETGALLRLEDIPSSPLLKRLSAAVNEWHPRLGKLRGCLNDGDSSEPLFGSIEESKKTQSCVIEDSLDTETVIDTDIEEAVVVAGDAFFTTRKNRMLEGRKLTWFNEFWDAYGYKSGKASAADSWLDIKGLSRVLVDSIVEGAKKEATRRKTLRDDQTPKMAQGWLTDSRWEDEIGGAATPSPEATQIWKEVEVALKSELSPASFEQWFDGAIPIASENGTFTLAVADAYTRGGIERRFGKQIEELLNAACGHETKLVVKSKEVE